MTEVVVPSTLLRGDSAYRTFGARPQRIGCGTWTASRGADERDVVYSCFALGWVLRGGARFVDHRGVERELRAGDAYARLPGRRHSMAYAADYTECWLDLGAELGALAESLGLVDEREPVIRVGIDLSLARRCVALVATVRAAPPTRLPTIAAELLALTAAILDPARRTPRDPAAALVDDACRLLEGDRGGRVRLERVARAHGVGYDRLRKLFRARVGCGPEAYRRRCRLDRARELLLADDRPLAAIAAHLGYASTAAFAQRFRAHVGVAPGRYRRGGG